MAKKGRRRVIFCSAWTNIGETPEEIAVYCFLLTGPQTTGHGIQQFSVMEGAARTKLDPGRFREVLGSVVKRHGWTWLEDWGILWIPTWWEWNTPDGPNQLKGAMTGFDAWPELPFSVEYIRTGLCFFAGKTRSEFAAYAAENWPKAYKQLQQGSNTIPTKYEANTGTLHKTLGGNPSPNPYPKPSGEPLGVTLPGTLPPTLPRNREPRTGNKEQGIEKEEDTNNASALFVCSEANDFALEPMAEADQPVMVFEVRGKTKTWGLSRAHIEKLEECFPDLDVLALCRKAKGWVEANPARKKTATGMAAFLWGWMSRSQNKGEGLKGEKTEDQHCLPGTILGVDLSKLGA